MAVFFLFGFVVGGCVFLCLNFVEPCISQPGFCFSYLLISFYKLQHTLKALCVLLGYQSYKCR